MKTKKLPIILSLFISACFLFSFTADDDMLTKLLASFQQHFKTNAQEKIYLHTDKPYYAVGDYVWFKAYVVDAQNLKPTAKSGVMYVDLIDEKDLVQKTLRLPLVAGLTWGSFELKDSIKEGNYRLRAYTTWMRNYDQAFFYDKTFKVGNAWTSQLVTKANYIFNNDGGNEKVNSQINFSNFDGYAYANKEVTYSVVIDDKVITRGKTKTDEKGDISLDFTDKASFGSNGRINASIKIGESTTIEKTIPIKSNSNSIDVQFFPEGGSLIQNVRSRVAFKALGADGLGKLVSGYVQDNEGNKIALIKTRHLGMGVFSLTPLTGKTYEAVVKFEDGSERNIKMPTANAEGATLSINNLDAEKILIKVSVNQPFLEKNLNKQFTVVAQNSGNIVYTASSELSSPVFAAELDKSRLLAGINQLTLFDDKMQPLAERLVFIAPKDTLSVSIKPDKDTYSQRSKTNLTIQAVSPKGKPLMGAFSLAVVDAGKVDIPNDEEESIFTNLLLTSDIKGYVEDPNYYFTNIDEEKILDTDVLMLTQGWRRFNWQDLAVAKPLLFKAEKALSISGKVTKGKKPVENGTVTIFSSGKTPLLLQAKTNALGEFMVDSLYFPDSTKFVVQGRDEKGKKYVDIELYNTSFPTVVKNKSQADLTININDSMMAYLKNSKSQYEEWLKNGIVNRSILLGEVVVVDKKQTVKESSNLNGAGNADKVLTQKDFQNAATLEQALQGSVAGLTFTAGIPYIRGQAAHIIMDGVDVDADFLSSINISDIESIEILKSIGYTAIYGSKGGGGVIVINTRTGDAGFSQNKYVPGVITYKPLGYLDWKEFYVPDYADPKLNTAVPDLRTTIYWNPNIITDSLGNANVSFYNGDNTGEYRVILEGTDLDGHFARRVINYRVVSNN